MSLKETPIDNDSFVDVDDIGEGDTALLCHTNDTDCCTNAQTGTDVALGKWFFPGGTNVPSSGSNFFRNRGQSVVRLNRRNNPSERGRFICELLGDTIYVNICECS